MSSKLVANVLMVAVALGAAVHAANDLTPPAVPPALEATGYKLFLKGHAVGTQNFICAPAAVPGGLDWLFIGPQATIFDEDLQQTLTHYQSLNPDLENTIHASWQHSRDSSAVWARKRTGSTDPNYVAPDAIEWLLLDVTGTQAGPAGGGRLARTAVIQRVNTVGGMKPPTAECTPESLNTRRLVPYQADYYFYR